jgi:hypothetical protein
MEDVSPSIDFAGTVRQVKTLVDGGIVFIFDVPETAIQQAAQLIAVKNAGIVLNVHCTAEGFTNKQSEKEVLTLEQHIQKTHHSIDEMEDDLTK